MKSEELQKLVLEALDDLKAIDTVVIDVRNMTTITDYMIICTGRSSRHVASLADNVVKKAKERGLTYIHTEGETEGEWVVVDLSDVVVHIMQAETRKFYNLEDLWETHAYSHSHYR